MRRTIAISGDLGSGKSTVAAELARRLGLRKVSLGDIHREMAKSRGMTALQLNHHSDRDPEVDAYVDGMQREMAQTDEPLVVDSRLGWYFFINAFKVQMHAEPLVAARRALIQPSSKTEAYTSVEEALRGLRERSDSERQRFLRTYGVDKADLSNYHLVCDSTSATPEEIVEAIIDAYESEGESVSPVLYLDPARVQVASPRAARPDDRVLSVMHHDSAFEAVGGVALLDRARERGDRLIRAQLVGSRDSARAGIFAV